MKTRKNGQVELMRFLFAVIVLLRHSSYINPDGSSIMLDRGGLAVELFFLLSGYLLAAHVDRQGNQSASLGCDTKQFIGRKMRALMPYLPISVLIGFGCSLIVSPVSNGYKLFERIFNSVFEVLFLYESGVSTGTVNSPTWYLSAMMISLFVLYPVCRKHFKTFIHVIAPVTGILLIGALEKSLGSLLNPNLVIWGIMYKGLPRAFAEICLGAACYPYAQRLQKTALRTAGRGVVLLAEAAAIIGAVVMIQVWPNGKADPFVLLLLCVGVTLAFSHQGLFMEKLDNKVCYGLGKLSLSLYLAHFPIAQLTAALYPDKPLGFRMIFYLTVSVACTLFIHFVSGVLRNRAGTIGSWFRKRLLIEAE